MNRFKQGVVRLRANWVYVIQAGLAAGLSYYVALHLFHHAEPFFAPMATVIVLSTTGGERFRRAFELVLGVSIGVGLGDVLIAFVGSGVWQIAVAVLIATILPPGTSGGADRMIDALVGGLVGIAVIALLPESPLRSGRREIANILGVAAQVQRQVAEALRNNNTDGIVDALVRARGTQGQINQMIAAANMGKETIQASPLLWAQRQRIRSMMRILNPVDNAMRNTRVLARRALVLCEDNDEVSGRQIQIIEQLAEVSEDLSNLYYGNSELSENAEIPRLVNNLKMIGSRTGLEVSEGKVLSAQVVLAQSRSLVVDLLQICGQSRRSAVEILSPTSMHPASVKEIWNDDV
ncbi:FUSC family protein [Corynebacterium diphtheriae]|uniref:FUSC family protein n=1 Tax=Corynebacterium diphtheriae TaxID=1717 RepID=UPI0018CB3C83|nr:FUSC family protein [Corynebacterium diphtheriae]MBG9263981.1 aromatic acid exporter family protein [Corynebacterium diphtheriae bv. gravis]